VLNENKCLAVSIIERVPEAASYGAGVDEDMARIDREWAI